MASKTVWIVGGLVVAIGVVAYVAFKPGPANTDAAGTIVEAKRARADGTNSFNPTPTASTTEQSAADSAKGTADTDAAKAADAAAAAGSSGANGKKAQPQGKYPYAMDAEQRAAEAADARAAAGAGGSNVARSHLDVAKSADAAAALGGGSSQARGLPKASNASSGISPQSSAESARKN
jgi:trimeric autotransporter adhesin